MNISPFFECVFMDMDVVLLYVHELELRIHAIMYPISGIKKCRLS